MKPTMDGDPTVTPGGGDDARLVAAYLAGDRSALGAVYDRYGQSLFDTATAMTGSRDDAADMVQDVFVLAAERLAQLRDPSRLKPWLFAILRNEVYRRSRRRSRQSLTDFSAPEHEVMLPPTSPSTDAVDDELDAIELAELLRGAALGLDARDQLVLELSVRQGLSGTDLADALGVSAQQSYGLLHRMRERTERSLGAYCVARRGRKDCSELASILAGWTGDFTVLLRKRVSRHIEDCNICERTRKRFAPLALIGSAPAFAAPIGLRASIMDRIALLHPSGPSASGGSSGSGTGGGGTRFRVRKMQGTPSFGKSDASNGFPMLDASQRIGRKIALWMLGTGAVGVLVLSGALLVNSDSPAVQLDEPTSAEQLEENAAVTLPVVTTPPTTALVTTTLPATTTVPPTTSTSTTSTTVPESTTTVVASAIPIAPTTTTIVTTSTRPATTVPTTTVPATTTTPAVTTTTTALTTTTTTAVTTTTTTTSPATTTTTTANQAPSGTFSAQCTRTDVSPSLAYSIWQYDFVLTFKVTDRDGDTMTLSATATQNGTTSQLTAHNSSDTTASITASGTAYFNFSTRNSASVDFAGVATDGNGGEFNPPVVTGVPTSCPRG